METRTIDLRLIRKRVEELEILEGRIKAGQDIPEIVGQMNFIILRLKLMIDEYNKSLLREYQDLLVGE